MNTDERTVGMILEKINGIDGKLDLFVTKAEFQPVRILVYGFVGIILVAVVSSMVYSVVVSEKNTVKAEVNK